MDDIEVDTDQIGERTERTITGAIIDNPKVAGVVVLVILLALAWRKPFLRYGMVGIALFVLVMVAFGGWGK